VGVREVRNPLDGMTELQHIAVIDIGKTNAKILHVDLVSGIETTVARRPNVVRQDGPYPHFDLEALWSFILSGLTASARRQVVDAISITTHGASAVLVGGDGALALPMLDYEHDGPDELAADYAALRPDFAETGAPRLPVGLNLGAQLHWQARRFPAEFTKVRHILTYPQYWSYRLTGVAASEATSLGCHTDLWSPMKGRFSGLVGAMGWGPLFPPLRKAGDVLGPLLPELARATGLPEGTPVLCGIHDSNASLVPWLGLHGPGAVISSGTWMIVMALGGATRPLDGARDVLVNVNAKGAPVPTARFMAGREFDEITQGRQVAADDAAEQAVLRAKVMAMPSLHPTTGPFPGQAFAWASAPPEDDSMRLAAASFYVALMGAACLSLVGAAGETVVEGPLARNRAFARMLATATGRPVVLAGEGAGTGLGAALLAGSLQTPRPVPVRVLPEADPLMQAYAAEWQSLVAARQSAVTA
jgi:sugar (pentulose or hexulose) kinase